MNSEHLIQTLYITAIICGLLSLCVRGYRKQLESKSKRQQLRRVARALYALNRDGEMVINASTGDLVDPSTVGLKTVEELKFEPGEPWNRQIYRGQDHAKPTINRLHGIN